MGLDFNFMDNLRVFLPGFRFHPTDEELVGYHLKRKICCKPPHMEVIAETDVYKFDPEELPGMSKLRTGDRQWFFFSPRDRKYPNGARSNRATSHGYWKATGKDRTITSNSRKVGIKKTLVFYRGRAPNGARTDWVMHEYTMDEDELKRCKNAKEYYALYKVFKKSGPGPKNGEQYGALFREEDWDNDDLMVQSFGVDADPLSKTDDDIAPCPNLCLLDDLKEFMKEIENDPIMMIENDRNALKLCGFEEETESNLVGDNTGLTEDEIFGDFIEMNDLLGPCQANEISYKLEGELLQLDELDGLTEFDFHDASSLPIDGGFQIPHPETYSDHFDYNTETITTASIQTYQLQQQSTNVNGISYSNPGFIHENHRTGANDDRKDDDSWLSSPFWSFVESIPTTPASASESAFVNRAFGRMSSFRRLRLNHASASGNTDSNVFPSSGKFRRTTTTALMLALFFGALCAVTWMFVGSSTLFL